MADPVASVEKIVKIGLKIKEAADTVRQNEEVCQEIKKRVLRFSAILSQLQRTGVLDNSSEMSSALEDLEETLERALELVGSCQERSTIRRLITAGELAKQLREVKDDILNKVMLASFAINTHTTILLLTIQTGGHPLPRQQEGTGVVEISHNSHSTDDDARYDRNGKENKAIRGSEASSAPLIGAFIDFSYSELKAATNGFSNIIDKGGYSKVFKGVLNNGTMVAVKRQFVQDSFGWSGTHNQRLLASKLQHKNIVKVLGWSHKIYYQKREGSFMAWLKDRIGGKIFFDKRIDGKIELLIDFRIEEYMPNGSLHDIIWDQGNGKGSQLDWTSIFRIIEGIAQGLHYLHEQHVVHRDVKPSNILLDSDMNSVITDFELALVLDDNSETVDDDIAGTFGYIEPEYMATGSVSRKGDVYAFGITILETIKCIRRCKQSRRVCDLHKWAVEAWEAGQIEEEFDPALFDESQLMEVKRCVEVGLMCCMKNRQDRPTMADVLEMLNGEKEMPSPKAWYKRPLWLRSPTDGSEGSCIESNEGAASPATWSEGSCSPH